MPDPRTSIVRAAIMAALAAAALAIFGPLQTQAAIAGGEVDAAVGPGEDFYAYANDAWLAATPLPEGVSRLDTTALLRAQNAQRVQALLEEAAANAPAGAPRSAIARMVGDYFSARLDTASIEARGLAPLSPHLAAIASISNRTALARYLGQTLRLDDGSNQQTESLWGVWIHQNFHDSQRYAAHLVQGGLGLDQQDYLDSAPEHVARRALYRAYVAGVLQALGFERADERALGVVALEAAIANTHAPAADAADVFKTDNTWRRADFAARAPGLDWETFFTAAGLDRAASFVVWQPQAIVGGSRLVATQPLDAWKDYLVFHLVDHYAAVLPASIRDGQRAFNARLSGLTSPAAADARREAALASEAVLGDAIGQMYVARYFSPQARASANAMVDNIRIAFRRRLTRLGWMSPENRAQALEKLATLRIGLGYPNNWVDYSALTVVRGDAFGNLERAEAFAYRREVAKLSRPIDGDEWALQLHPQMVGAILNLSPNSMQFSAGLLQPPYFDPVGDAASNYGSAGAGIAHEISHSFDEVGAIYDAQGRLTHWLSEVDLARLHAATAPLAAQLNGCCPMPDRCAHGGQILGESAADLTGLVIAHDAYLISLHGRGDVIKNGLTGEQRFFIAFAQRWRRQQGDAALRQQIESDSHAPPQCRGNLVRNVDAWVSAFNVRPGDRLYVEPQSRLRVW